MSEKKTSLPPPFEPMQSSDWKLLGSILLLLHDWIRGHQSDAGQDTLHFTMRVSNPERCVDYTSLSTSFEITDEMRRAAYDLVPSVANNLPVFFGRLDFIPYIIEELYEIKSKSGIRPDKHDVSDAVQNWMFMGKKPKEMHDER